jgi:hypothetical protein
MHFTARRSTRLRFLRPGLVLALMLTSVPSLRASELPALRTPPAFPDAQHVLNGCFISTIAYVARFRAAFPAERAQPLTVELKKFHGLHTIAVVSWRGEWWGRDEFFGVFALGLRVPLHPDPDQLVARAQRALDAHAEREVEAGRGSWAPPPPRTLPAAERAHWITQAAAALPHPGEMYWLYGDALEFPVLFFRPAPGLVCFYEPLTGTAQAETTATHAPSVVKAIASRLGRRINAVRPAAAHPAGARIAAK